VEEDSGLIGLVSLYFILCIRVGRVWRYILVSSGFICQKCLSTWMYVCECECPKRYIYLFSNRRQAELPLLSDFIIS
jgi:hypothetical protein